MGVSGFQVSGIRDSGFEASGFEASGPRIQSGYPFIFVTNTSKGYIRGIEKSMEYPTSFVLRTLPYGSEDSNHRLLGPKYYNISGIWALKL